jgi:hypothetical protein
VPSAGRTARFIEPMLLLRTDKLPEGDGWLYEVKFDGYRALAIKERRAGSAPVSQRQGLHQALSRSGGGAEGVAG